MKAALYIRVSTHHQIDKESLPFQRSELINYAKYILNLDEYEIFEDAGYSGKNTDRPAFQDMMKRIKNKEFTHLLVWKIDRISRNLLDFCTMYDEIKSYGVIFISKNEQFDTSSAMGEAMLKIILVFAELERKLTAERVSSIMLSRAEKGLWNGANVPLGYDYDDKIKSVVINPKEAEIIKMIFNAYEETNSATRVMRYVNNNNISTKRGGRWTSKTITDIIRNPIYKGTYRYNYRESARGAKKDEKEWIVIDNNHENIIPTEQWEKCNKIMDKNAQRNSSMYRKGVNTHVFSGVLKCELCGRGFISNTDQPRKDGWKPSTYRCQGRARFFDCDAGMTSDVKIGSFVINYISNFIKAINLIEKINSTEELEKILLKGENFKNLKLSKEELEYTLSILSSINISNSIKNSKKIKIKPKINVNSTKLQAEKEKYTRALERLEDLYLFDEHTMSEKDYILKKKKIEEKINEIDIELSNIDKVELIDLDFSFLNNSALKYEILNKEYIDFKEIDMNASRESIRDIVKNIIDNIVIKKKGEVASIKFKNGITHTFIYEG